MRKGHALAAAHQVEPFMACGGMWVRPAALSFLRELQTAGFDVSATGSRLIVEPEYCLSQDDRAGIARHGAALAELLENLNDRRKRYV